MNKATKFIAANYFFALVLGLFAFEASYLAIKNGFPMAYDEAYHLGLIVFFSHHVNPIITSQPPNTYSLGAIIHKPSFLYYYLLSFPYRLIVHWTSNLKVIVILLRLINIIFGIGSLVIMRKALRLIGLGKALSNMVVLVFALTPILAVLSSVINYNNLMIFLGSICIYWALLLLQTLRRGHLNIRLLLWLIALCMLTSMVDFEFLPVFLGIGACILFALIRKRGIAKGAFFQLLKRLRQGHSYIFRIRNVFLLIVGALSLTLFISSYGFDAIKYRNPEPQCNQILTIHDCQHYYSWDRNYTAAQHDTFSHNITFPSMLHYSYIWFGQMRTQLFAAQSPLGKLVQAAPIFHYLVLALAVVALLCCLRYIKEIVSSFELFVPLAVIVIVYIGFLWGRNYYDYKMLGQAVAIQARYLLPVLIYIYALLALGFYYALRASKLGYLRVAIAGLVIVSFVYFGGFSRYATKVTPSYTWGKYDLNQVYGHEQI